jgi:hypothetical protein
MGGVAGETVTLKRGFTNGKWCVRFWYVIDMRDVGPGTLFTVMSVQNGEEAQVWRMTEEDVAGMSSTQWKEASVHIVMEEAEEHEVLQSN